LRGASLDVRSGEIVGVAGVEGNGQRELAEIVAGLRPYRGEVSVGGGAHRGVSPGELRARGLAHVPEDRLGAGLVADFTVAENLLLGRQRESRFRRGGALDLTAVREHARERLEAFDVRPPDPDRRAAALSGGNQQKVVIAREAEGSPRLLIAAHPTRGVDVGAREAIHSALLELREAGAAVLLLSADLPEILHLSDRVVVLFGGRVTAEFARGEADEETLGLHMIGGAA
jgi:simple sugar transport system ATP-binding protein